MPSYRVRSVLCSRSQGRGVILVRFCVRMVSRSTSSAASEMSAAVIASKYGLSAAERLPSPHPASQSVRQPASFGARMAASCP